jgi:DNA-binding NtrC family response regulator
MPDVDGITLLREWAAANSARQCPVMMMSGHGTVETAVEATRLGAVDFIEKPVSLAKLLRTVERALEADRAGGKGGRGLVPQSTVPVGHSRAMQALREQAERVAGHDTNVLVTGEAGSGRELFARYIHSMGPRARGPFVRLVASALQDAGAEAALFGRAFQGSVEPGLLERAEGGTLFIKNLQDLGTESQRLLLGAFESGRYRPLGSDTVRPLDARVIAAAPPGFERAPPAGLR